MQRGSPLLGVGKSQLTGALPELVRTFGAEGAVAAVEQNMQVRVLSLTAVPPVEESTGVSRS